MTQDDELKRIRDLIDEADQNIVDALSRRMRLVEEVGEYKKKHGLHVYDAARQREVITKAIEGGRRRHLVGNLVHDIFETILKYSKELQK